MNIGEFLFMLSTVTIVSSVIFASRFLIHRIASDEYEKKERIRLLEEGKKYATLFLSN